MHTFQPLPIDVVEFNPFTRLGKDWALVTAGSKAKSNAMTISWGGVGVLWGKNVVYIVVRDSRATKELLDAGDFFSITFFDSDRYRDALNYCGSHSGKDEPDKIANAGLTTAYRHSIPYVDEGNFVFLCRKLAATRLTEENFLVPEIKKWYEDGDMHTMYIGEIIDLMAR
jgi:flavin reductase (DIM6/NTAB) family NADH-FMN oxidoreductase RutF